MKRILFVLSMLFFSASSHSADGYYDSSGNALPEITNWMSYLPGRRLLSNISMFGVHHLQLKDNYSIESSHNGLKLYPLLKSGARYVDISFQHLADQLIIDGHFHGKFIMKCLQYGRIGCARKDTKFTAIRACNGSYCPTIDKVRNTNTNGDGLFDGFQKLEAVVADLVKFVKEYPSETLLLRLSISDDSFGNTSSFENKMEQLINRYSDHFWIPNTNDPMLRDIRGQIVILDDTKTNPTVAFGLNFNLFNVHDSFYMNTNFDLYSHWEDIKTQLNSACELHYRNGRERPISECMKSFKGNKINYLTGGGGSFSYFVASGKSSPGNYAPRLITGYTSLISPNTYPDFPRISCFLGTCTIAFAGTNELTMNYIIKHQPSYVGIIVADYPGHCLISNVIFTNFSGKFVQSQNRGRYLCKE